MKKRTVQYTYKIPNEIPEATENYLYLQIASPNKHLCNLCLTARDIINEQVRQLTRQ